MMKLFRKYGKFISAFTLVSIVNSLVLPTSVYAYQEGVTQSEHQRKNGTADLVNPYTGEFNYSIPLINMGGDYSISLNYSSSSVSMLSNPSAVGEGFNLSCFEQISRETIEVPDDFKGDQITTRSHVRPYQSTSINLSKVDQEEIFGFLNPFYSGENDNEENDETTEGASKAEKESSKNFLKEYKLASIYWNNVSGIGAIFSNEETAKQKSKYGNYVLSHFYDTQRGLTFGLTFQSGLSEKFWAGASLNYNAKEKLFKYGLSSTAGSFSFGKTRLSSVTTSMITTTDNTLIKLGIDKGENGEGENRFGVGTYGPYIGSPPTATKQKLNGKNYQAFSFLHGGDRVYDVTSTYSGVLEPVTSKSGYGFLYLKDIPIINTGDEQAIAEKKSKIVKDYRRDKVSYQKGTPFLPGSMPGADQFIRTGGSGSSAFKLVDDNVQVYSPTTAFTKAITSKVAMEFGNHQGTYDVPTQSGTVPVTDFHLGFEDNQVLGVIETGEVGEESNLFGTNPESKLYFKSGGANIESMQNNTLLQWGGNDATAMEIEEEGHFFEGKKRSKFTTVHSNSFTNSSGMVDSKFFGSSERAERKQYIQYLTLDEAQLYGDMENSNYLTDNSYARDIADSRGHQIGEINVFEEGMKYSYGNPVYNKSRKDVVTSLEQPSGSIGVADTKHSLNDNWDATNGQAVYGKTSDGLGDEYLEEIEVGPYASAWLLNHITDDNYVDNGDGIVGDGDRGKWVKFNYDYTTQSISGIFDYYISDYRWRTPYEDASLIQGVRGHYKDDKLHYSTGVREVVYVKSIETKLYRAEFEYEGRKDGYGASSEKGDGVSTSSPLKRVKNIKVYVKNGTTQGKLIQTTTFGYDEDYPLGVKVPSNLTGGKLTLKSVHSTYYDSERGANYKYEFSYIPEQPANSTLTQTEWNEMHNPKYNEENIDRWGDFKRNIDENGNRVYGDDYAYGDFSYAQQQVDVIAPYKLKGIKLPSGATLKIDYERNDYAYSEDQEAIQMFDILSTSNTVQSYFDNPPTDNFVLKNSKSFVNQTDILRDIKDNDHIIIAIEDMSLVPVSSRNMYFYDRYLRNIENEVYIKAYVRLGGIYSTEAANYDFVELVASIEEGGYEVLWGDMDVDGKDEYYGKIKLNKRSTSGVSRKINPIRFAAIEKIKNDRSEFIFGLPTATVNLSTLVTNVVDNLADIFPGSTGKLLSQGLASDIKCKGWSVIALKNPTGTKKGGGWRVAKITLEDHWNDSNDAGFVKSQKYVQSYTYKTTKVVDGKDEEISSGVAYEPMMGKEENANTDFFEFTQQNLSFESTYGFIKGTPLDMHMPGPSVGYSKVTVKTEYQNVDPALIKRSVAPHTIYEFYTPKDFPIVKKFTTISGADDKPSDFSATAGDLLTFAFSDHSYSQGVYMLKNNMAGAPRKVTELTRDNDYISDQTFFYKEETMSSMHGYVDPEEAVFSASAYNKRVPGVQVSTIDKDRLVRQRKKGEDYQIWVDLTQDKELYYGEVGITADLGIYTYLPFVKYLVPFPDKREVDSEKTRKYGTVNKIVTRSGVLQSIVTRKLNSELITENIAYDETYGDLILAKMQNEFNYSDEIGTYYKLSIPGHWHYGAFHGKYENGDHNHGGVINYITDAYESAELIEKLKIGDKLFFNTSGGGFQIGYVDYIKADDQKFRILNLNNVEVNANQIWGVRIINSGNANYASIMVGEEVAQLSNYSEGEDNYTLTLSKHINVSASTFKGDWLGECCLVAVSPNPYENRTLNSWKPYQTFQFNDKRSYSGGGNTINDGLILNYTSFDWSDPLENAKWILTGTATHYGQNGELKEQNNAIGLYSSSLVGYGGLFVRSSASNSAFQESSFDGFEEYKYDRCQVDGDLDIEEGNVETNVVTEHPHTGKYSLKVNPGQLIDSKPVVILDCNE